MTRREVLLACGVLSPLLYAFADALSGALWSYSYRDQTISELGAIGAPSRLVFSLLLIPTYLLLLAFGFGVRQSAVDRPRLRVAGGLVIALAVLALSVGQFVPMRMRGTEQGLAGALHLAQGLAAMLMVLGAMGLAAAELRGLFRAYTILTIAVVLAFGAWSAMEAPAIEAGLATPWVGIKERVFWYAYQLWFAVLALSVMRGQPGRSSHRHGARHARS
jgi:hypothetical protein